MLLISRLAHGHEASRTSWTLCGQLLIDLFVHDVFLRTLTFGLLDVDNEDLISYRLGIFFYLPQVVAIVILVYANALPRVLLALLNLIDCNRYMF